jgi:hypothetical protein
LSVRTSVISDPDNFEKFEASITLITAAYMGKRFQRQDVIAPPHSAAFKVQSSAFDVQCWPFRLVGYERSSMPDGLSPLLGIMNPSFLRRGNK